MISFAIVSLIFREKKTISDPQRTSKSSKGDVPFIRYNYYLVGKLLKLAITTMTIGKCSKIDPICAFFLPNVCKTTVSFSND